MSAEDKWTLVSYSTIGPLLIKKPKGPNLILPSNRSMLIKGHYLFITTTVPDATCQVSRTLPCDSEEKVFFMFLPYIGLATIFVVPPGQNIGDSI